jgi:hypothetical protein
MPRSGTEVAGVELIGGTDLGRGRTSGWSVVATGGASLGGAHGEGGIRREEKARSVQTEQTTRAGARRKGSGQLIHGPSGRTDDL